MKYFLLLALSALLFSCGSDSEEKIAPTSSEMIYQIVEDSYVTEFNFTGTRLNYIINGQDTVKYSYDQAGLLKSKYSTALKATTNVVMNSNGKIQKETTKSGEYFSETTNFYDGSTLIRSVVALKGNFGGLYDTAYSEQNYKFYNGNLIEQVDYSWNNKNKTKKLSDKFNYTYDDKKSPHSYLLYELKNNVVSYSDQEQPSNNYTMTYQYNSAGYPISFVRTMDGKTSNGVIKYKAF